MFHVSDQADDLAHLFAAIVRRKSGLDAFSDHVLTREIFLGETLVHDHDRSRSELIALVENAAGADRNAHGFEVIGRDDANGSGRTLPLWQRMICRVEG